MAPYYAPLSVSSREERNNNGTPIVGRLVIHDAEISRSLRRLYLFLLLPLFVSLYGFLYHKRLDTMMAMSSTRKSEAVTTTPTRISSVESATRNQQISSNTTALPSKWPKHNNVIYGHIHMAKTAGTEINGELAVRYERVCGHKGYSYDAYQHNNRADSWKEKNPGKDLSESGGEKDLVSSAHLDHNRGRVPSEVMNEIGYQDCDWISHEAPFAWWSRVAKVIQPHPFELHVPCREPIDSS